MINFRLAGATLLATRLGTGALLAAASLATSAQTAVVFDSLSGGQRFFSQCFACSSAPVLELGDIVTLAGTERRLQTITVALEQDINTDSSPYQLSLTMELYSVDDNLQVSSIGSRTVGLDISASGIYSVPIDFRGVDVPGTFYYGLSATSASPQLADLRLSLWDYYDPTVYFGDGQSLPVGTDVGTQVLGLNQVNTQVYARLASDPTRLRAVGADGWGEDLAAGYTPMIQIVAAPVPEPQSLALFLAGGLALVLMGRRKGQQR